MKAAAIATIVTSPLVLGSTVDSFQPRSPSSPNELEPRIIFSDSARRCAGDLFQRGSRMLLYKDSRNSVCKSLMEHTATEIEEVTELLDSATETVESTVTADPFVTTLTTTVRLAIDIFPTLEPEPPVVVDPIPPSLVVDPLPPPSLIAEDPSLEPPPSLIVDPIPPSLVVDPLPPPSAIVDPIPPELIEPLPGVDDTFNIPTPIPAPVPERPTLVEDPIDDDSSPTEENEEELPSDPAVGVPLVTSTPDLTPPANISTIEARGFLSTWRERIKANNENNKKSSSKSRPSLVSNWLEKIRGKWNQNKDKVKPKPKPLPTLKPIPTECPNEKIYSKACERFGYKPTTVATETVTETVEWEEEPTTTTLVVTKIPTITEYVTETITI